MVKNTTTRSTRRKKKAPADRGGGILKSGDRIVLHRGEGAKRQYNGHAAVVSDFPAKGGWMTVNVVQESKTTRIKWRKGRFTMKAPETTTTPPLLQENWVRIFGFLGSSTEIRVKNETSSAKRDEEELLWVRDAARLHTQLASVCSLWRLVCDHHLASILGRLDANLDALRIEKVVPCIHWLCKHKIALGALKFDAEFGDIPFLEKLLSTCDTSELTKVRAFCHKSCVSPERDSDLWKSRWVSSAYHDIFSPSGPCVDLTEDVEMGSFELMAATLGVPFRDDPQQHELQDVLALNCPNLLELSINVAMPNGPVCCPEYLGMALFSMHKLSKMEISLGMIGWQHGDPLQFDGMIVARMVENLPQLKELTLKSGLFCTSRQLHVVSSSLRTLNTSGLSKFAWVSCQCPNLERFECSGYSFAGNGTIPHFSTEQRQNLSADSFHGSALHIAAGRATFEGLDVPPSCECIMHDYRAPENFALEDFRNARLETFD